MCSLAVSAASSRLLMSLTRPELELLKFDRKNAYVTYCYENNNPILLFFLHFIELNALLEVATKAIPHSDALSSRQQRRHVFAF
jgi:hypothetical protein